MNIFPNERDSSGLGSPFVQPPSLSSSFVTANKGFWAMDGWMTDKFPPARAGKGGKGFTDGDATWARECTCARQSHTHTHMTFALRTGLGVPKSKMR